MENFSLKKLFILLVVGLLGAGFAFWQSQRENTSAAEKELAASLQTGLVGNETVVPNVDGQVEIPGPVVNEYKFVGPRGNLPAGAPADYGFWSFAVVDPNVLSRSGQPLLSEFQWLKQQGWKSDIDLRADGEYGEIADDKKMPGFNEIGLNYLWLPIADGAPPTDEQAEEFLKFVTNPENQPAHVHCRGGIGRAGTMVALYRYAVQGWPMGKAIEESRLFQGGVSDSQSKWLKEWAKNHEPDDLSSGGFLL